jgi:hypothetical protein
MTVSTTFKFGSVLLLTGSVMLYTLWASNFTDYMYLEDLALENSPAAEALGQVSPGERILLYGALAQILLGLAMMTGSGIAKLRTRKS